ncbi:MAG: hypothetical protein ACRDNG_00935 [Gaiellaceae bacterium]
MRRERRWRLVALLATGIALGVVMTGTPAGAHVASWAHNWKKHIKPRTDAHYQQRLWAVVEDDSTLVRGKRVTSVIEIGTGRTVVRFNRSVVGCAYIATLGFTGSTGIGPPGEVSVVGEGGNARGVWVTTRDSAGAPADRAFHLAVHC